jgi:hypothetical protein
MNMSKTKIDVITRKFKGESTRYSEFGRVYIYMGNIITKAEGDSDDIKSQIRVIKANGAFEYLYPVWRATYL